jgi:O-antigen ligase
MSVASPAPVFPADQHRAAPVLTPRSAVSLAAGMAPSRLNWAFGIILVAAVAVAPVPLGSNRPVFWSLWAIALGGLAVIYGLGLVLTRTPARRSLADYWPEVTGLGLLMAWLGIQSLPLGQWLPSLTAAPGTGVPANSISLDPGSTRLTLMTFGVYAVLFGLVTLVAVNRRRARGMLLAIFVVIAGFAAYSLVSLTQLGDTLLGFQKLHYGGVATGTFINRNSFATFLAAGLASGVPLLGNGFGKLQGAGHTSRLIQIALVLLGMMFIAAALFATGSRMGVIAGGAGMLVAIALLLPKAGKPRLWLGFGLIAVAIAGLAGLVLAFGTDTIERFIFVSDETGRSELYRQVWAAILQRPLLGYGGGSFAAVFPVFQHAPLINDTIWDKAHSTYLALWFELGLVGGTIPMLIVAMLLYRAVRGLWDSSSRSLCVAAIAVVVVFALHSLVDFSAEIMADAFLFTAILALGAAGDRRRDSR